MCIALSIEISTLLNKDYETTFSKNCLFILSFSIMQIEMVSLGKFIQSELHHSRIKKLP